MPDKSLDRSARKMTSHGFQFLDAVLVSWVSPILTDFSLARANRIGSQLQQSNPALLNTAATFPSIATTRVHGRRWITTLVPRCSSASRGGRMGHSHPDRDFS